MHKRKILAVIGALLTLLCLLASPAQAHPGGRGWHRGYYHGGYYHHGWYAWHHGFWRHSWYGGRFGWWWVVGGVWFFYPRPIYPYPDPNIPPDYLPTAAATGTPPPQTWYYCDAAKTYYPYVASCSSGWRAVPATPAPTAPKAPG